MKLLKKRLAKLNEIIDLKIIMGKSYSKEAKEHADILYFLKNNS